MLSINKCKNIDGVEVISYDGDERKMLIDYFNII